MSRRYTITVDDYAHAYRTGLEYPAVGVVGVRDGYDVAEAQ
ncbi:MAG: hypothetical protein HW390_1377 [Candidatus Brocadiaceae bacterium]|nr:hypothetical protein [Candidatus Brocadiaceae bacterium]